MNRIQNIILLSLFFHLSLLGCSGGAFSSKGRPLSELASQQNVSSQYVANIGDTLNVQVWGEPSVSGAVRVRDDGRFTLPLVGDISAANLSLKEVAKKVTTQLKEFIPAASVSVSVVQTAPIRYYLSGMFVKPGEYKSEGRITLLQAVATGGGFAPFANENAVILIRKAAEGDYRYKLNYNKVIQGREPNPTLKNGDVIAVQ